MSKAVSCAPGLGEAERSALPPMARRGALPGGIALASQGSVVHKRKGPKDDIVTALVFAAEGAWYREQGREYTMTPALR